MVIDQAFYGDCLFPRKRGQNRETILFFSNRGNWYKHGQLCGKKHLNMENLLQNLKQHSPPAIFVMTRLGTAMVVCPAHMLLSKYICGHCEAISAFRKKIFVLLDSTFLHLPPSKNIWLNTSFSCIIMAHVSCRCCVYIILRYVLEVGSRCTLLSAIFWHGSHF
jgi:hypothetical protein